MNEEMSAAKRQAYDILHRIESLERTAETVLKDVQRLREGISKWEQSISWGQDKEH